MTLDEIAVGQRVSWRLPSIYGGEQLVAGVVVSVGSTLVRIQIARRVSDGWTREVRYVKPDRLTNRIAYVHAIDGAER